MKYTFEMASGGMIYVSSFMKSFSKIQVILRVLPYNLRGYSTGIANGKIL
jgi:hypothetical protein